MPRGGVEKERIGRGPRERCRSVPQGGVKKRERERERSVADRESSIAQCHGVALKKKKGKKNDRSWTEREVYRYPSIRYK